MHLQFSVAPRAMTSVVPSSRTARFIPSLVKLFASAAFVAAPLSAMAAHWYVDGKSGNDAAAGDSSRPLRTVTQAWNRAYAGDTIHIKPTITYGRVYLSGKSGASGRPITIQGDSTSNMPKISGKSASFGIMLDRVSHVTLKNLNVTAPGTGTYSGWSAFYIKNSHHINVTGNVAHHAACTGIQTESSDYLTITGNRVYNNANVVKNGVYCSGISLHENRDIDGNTGTKMVVRGNYVYNNRNITCCTNRNSDGNGIIIDDSRRTQTDYKAYRGAHLIENNVVFNNGGRGIHMYKSDRATIRNNTLYRNNTDRYISGWRPGEISVLESGGANIYNNVFYSAASSGTSTTGQHVSISIQSSYKGAAHNVNYNLNYNAKGNSSLQTYFRNNPVGLNYGGNNKWGNPRFKTASTDGSSANFRPVSGSPAFGFHAPSYTFAPKDFLSVTRMSPVTAGAYQKPAY